MNEWRHNITAAFTHRIEFVTRCRAPHLTTNTNFLRYVNTQIDWLIEHGFMSAPKQYIGYTADGFLQVWWPNQQCQSTEGGWLVIQTGLNLTMLTSLCYNTTTCMQILHKKIIKHTQSNLSTVSELSEMKPNLVDRTCKLFKWVCNYKKLHNKTTREQLRYYSLLLLTKP